MARIVVVDDEPIIGEIASRILTGAGHEVLMALNGQDAVNMLAAESASFSLAQSGSGSIAHVRFRS